MKKIIIVLSIVAVAFASCQTGATKEGAQEGKAKTGRKIKTESDSLSYAFGTIAGDYLKNMKKNVGEELNIEVALGAIRDVMGDKPTLDMDESQAFLQHYFTTVFPEKQKAEGEKFLANIEKTTPNVKKTESGILYDIIEPGSDVKPAATDKVQVSYKGELKDGTEFDNSEKHGGSVTFGLNQVIPGWSEGLQLIGEGGKIKLWIPSDLAYGANPNPYSGIPPHAPLVFEVELIKVNPEE